jgi:hypothetical protein
MKQQMLIVCGAGERINGNKQLEAVAGPMADGWTVVQMIAQPVAISMTGEYRQTDKAYGSVIFLLEKEISQ